jgi:ABC-type polysaccharide/polyol phosphate export permease
MDISRGAHVVTHSTSVRPGPVGLVAEAVRDVWSRRRLIRYLVRADMKKKGADTLLGNLWWVIDPLLQMVVYAILVTIIFQQDIEAYPLFIFAAILPWKWFTSSMGDATVAVSGHDRLIKQVQFPKVVLPVSAVLAGIVQFGFGLIPLVGLLVLFYPSHLSAWLFLIPAVAVVQLVFTLGLGFAVAAVNVFFRDIGNVIRHLLRLWFYLSPGLYGAAVVDGLTADYPTIGALLKLNPFYTMLNAYRDLIYYGRSPDWLALGVVLAVSAVGLLAATALFKRLEPSYAKVL